MLKHVNAKCKFFCQSNVSYYLEVTKKIPERSIKLCVYGLKARCVTLFHYSISHNFPALRGWNEKCEAKLKNLDSQNQQCAQNGKHLRNQG